MNVVLLVHSTDVRYRYAHIYRNLPNQISKLRKVLNTTVSYFNVSIDDLFEGRRMGLSAAKNNLYRVPLVEKVAKVWAENDGGFQHNQETMLFSSWSIDYGKMYSSLQMSQLPGHVEVFCSMMAGNYLYNTGQWLCGKEIKEIEGVQFERHYACLELCFSDTHLPSAEGSKWFGVKRDFRLGSSVVEGKYTRRNLGYCFNVLMSQIFKMIESFLQTDSQYRLAAGFRDMSGVQSFSKQYAAARNAYGAHEHFGVSEGAVEGVFDFEPHPVGGCFAITNQNC